MAGTSPAMTRLGLHAPYVQQITFNKFCELLQRQPATLFVGLELCGPDNFLIRSATHNAANPETSSYTARLPQARAPPKAALSAAQDRPPCLDACRRTASSC